MNNNIVCSYTISQILTSEDEFKIIEKYNINYIYKYNFILYNITE